VIAPPTIARPAPAFEDERTDLARMRRETAALADETLDMIAEATRLLDATRGQLERAGQISEALRAVTIPPAQRRRPARLAPDRA
jgi:hypothetical protein